MLFKTSTNSSVETFDSSATLIAKSYPSKSSPMPSSSTLQIPVVSLREPVPSFFDSIKALRKASKAKSSSSSKPRKESGLEALERLRGSSGHPSVQAYSVSSPKTSRTSSSTPPPYSQEAPKPSSSPKESGLEKLERLRQTHGGASFQMR